MSEELPENNISDQPSFIKKNISLINLALIVVLAVTIIIIAQSKSTLQTQINQAQKQISALQITQAATGRALQTEVSSQNKSLQQLQFNVVQLLKDSVMSDRNQQLNLIKNLIYQAQYTINLNADLKRAATLLETAQAKITQLNQPDLLLLDRELTKSIIAIKQSEHIFDITKTIKAIDHVRSLVQLLPNSPEKSFHPPKVKTSKVTSNHWYSGVQSILCGFKNLIIIRHHDAPISPLLSNNEISIIKNNIALKLNQAQAALLTHNQQLFTNSIQSITIQLQRLPKQKSTPTIIKQLQNLHSLNINPPRPQLSAAIAAINALINTQPTKSKQPHAKRKAMSGRKGE